MYPPTLGYYAGQGALPFSEGQQLPNFGSAGPGISAQVGSLRDSLLHKQKHKHNINFGELQLALDVGVPLNSLKIG
jgi:hypothetical protein